MADRSHIEWTDATWTIVQGCDPVSPGCTHCYAVQLLWRLAHHPNPKISGPLAGLVERHKGELRFTGKVALREDRLDWPLKWREPRMIFVPSHGDLFHKNVPDQFIDKVFAVMALCPQHTFQVLTKRAKRMRAYLSADDVTDRIGEVQRFVHGETCAYINVGCDAPWPLPNVWLGVSAEDQQRADERIPDLLATPAAARFVSLEPLLGPIDLGAIVRRCTFDGSIYPDGKTHPLGWAIVGGESGKSARPMHPDWARSIRDQCVEAGVPFFFKQWGEWGPALDSTGAVRSEGHGSHGAVFENSRWSIFERGDRHGDVFRLGKARAGRTLDGREWNEMPWVRR